jgi:hypothetical protein
MLSSLRSGPARSLSMILRVYRFSLRLCACAKRRRSPASVAENAAILVVWCFLVSMLLTTSFRGGVGIPVLVRAILVSLYTIIACFFKPMVMILIVSTIAAATRESAAISSSSSSYSYHQRHLRVRCFALS